MFRLGRRKSQEEPVEEPTDPILPCDVEKLVLANGDEVLLDTPKISHVVNGRVIRGRIVDPDTGRTLDSIKVIEMSQVVRHVMMGWRNSTRTLHELPGHRPSSLRR